MYASKFQKAKLGHIRQNRLQLILVSLAIALELLRAFSDDNSKSGSTRECVIMAGFAVITIIIFFRSYGVYLDRLTTCIFGIPVCWIKWHKVSQVVYCKTWKYKNQVATMPIVFVVPYSCCRFNLKRYTVAQYFLLHLFRVRSIWLPFRPHKAEQCLEMLKTAYAPYGEVEVIEPK